MNRNIGETGPWENLARSHPIKVISNVVDHPPMHRIREHNRLDRAFPMIAILFCVVAPSFLPSLIDFTRIFQQ
jgi:hypothetical protein